MRHYALIGQPVSHSKSPQMHVSAYKELGLKANYTAYDVSETDLSTVINRMRNGEIDGMNVTIPHKVAIINYLDAIDNDARIIGAVNTVVRKENQLIGFNTDAPGFIQSLKQAKNGAPFQKKKALVLGAGGAARAIIYAMSEEGVQVTLTNRTMSKATALANDFSQYGIIVQDLSMTEERLGDYDIVVNTTSVGMYPHVDELPLKLENLSPDALVCDLIYNPMETAILKEAKKRGNPILNGLGMFVNQAAFSIRHWTGLMPNSSLMAEAVKKEFL
ncbi:shikimate dehydrogenase [Alkalihalobacillus xiaoxiensis]|uniref:Shikimate dehydrogenase (NADP(+)) n=1 Tax=Shouchella xiaoxiensis TaxID=766895 RepID=A0ABS2SRC4_9BACI|nr:shikimate dehydrogenase [Shouchella xiaoxiensis]MBM7838060.1 shikimate dehydrogenase [Shouchella xiaoxiensis]